MRARNVLTVFISPTRAKRHAKVAKVVLTALQKADLVHTPRVPAAPVENSHWGRQVCALCVPLAPTNATLANRTVLLATLDSLPRLGLRSVLRTQDAQQANSIPQATRIVNSVQPTNTPQQSVHRYVLNVLPVVLPAQLAAHLALNHVVLENTNTRIASGVLKDSTAVVALAVNSLLRKIPPNAPNVKLASSKPTLGVLCANPVTVVATVPPLGERTAALHAVEVRPVLELLRVPVAKRASSKPVKARLHVPVVRAASSDLSLARQLQFSATPALPASFRPLKIDPNVSAAQAATLLLATATQFSISCLFWMDQEVLVCPISMIFSVS